jgi:hypothetical protein
MRDPYLQFGDNFYTPRRRKSHIAQSEKDAPMVKRGVEKELEENEAQLRRARLIWRREIQAILDGPRGQNIQKLMTMLEKLAAHSADHLFGILDLFGILEEMNWFRGTSEHTRFLILGLIDDAIIRMRIREGLPPIDDSLPNEEPTAFEICRSNLNREE